MAFKFNPITGNLDLVESNEPNFSFNKIDQGQSIEIPDGQEMLVQSDIMVDGDVMVSGNAIQLPDYQSGFFFTKIASNESITVPTNRLLLFANSLMVDGNLMIEGELTDAFFGIYF